MADRSMHEEFLQGTIDNSYIQLAPNVGGLVETAWRVDRAINQCPYQYMNCEVRGLNPMDTARVHREQAIEPYSRYLPRRQPVQRI